MRHSSRYLTALILLGLLVAITAAPQLAAAVQNPQSQSVGLEATVSGSAPDQAATIGLPASGQVFTSTPITVSGLCKTGLLIKIFSNNVFVGSVVCVGGSYSLKVDLFSGRNDLVARVYDALDQQGPDSNVVTVTFNDAQFAQFGSHVSVTSTYARIGANPSDPLTLPLIINGGRAPYALSVDWGDGDGADLKTVSFAGVTSVTHTYRQAGVYTIVVKVTDNDGTSAYLQVVGVANGKISGAVGATSSSSGNGTVRTVIIWWPLLIALPLMILTFLLGQRHERYSIRRSIEESRENS